MILDIFIKEGDSYKKCKIVPPAGSDFTFFKSLKMTIEEQLDTIRNDITKLYPDGWHVSLINPKIDDYEKQGIIDKLVEFRTLNMKAKEFLNNMLKGTEFIICKNCGGKMYKHPTNVPYTRMGNSFIISDCNKNTVNFVFTCESCVFFVDERIYRWQQSLKNQREELLAQGETFVPDDLGFWHHEGDIKKIVADTECRHVFKRTIELYAIGPKNKQETITKIQDKCCYCGVIEYNK